MHYHIITIFPEIFDSFATTSLIAKAQEKGVISLDIINPRDFCTDKHQQIDDMPYGGGAGMVMKAEPVIDSIKHIMTTLQGDPCLSDRQASTPPSLHSGSAQDDGLPLKVILLGPSEEVFTQSTAHALVDGYEHIIFICGRYEGIDHRVELRCQQEFGEHFSKLSLGQFVTLGGEVPAMTMIEATARLIPGVIKEEVSWQDESYRPEQGGNNLEYPQYTRPEEVEGLHVPDVLLSGHHAEIANWRKSQTS